MRISRNIQRAEGNDRAQEVQPVGVLEFEEYSRLPNTANSCVFFGCVSQSRLRVPRQLVIRFLVEYYLYIPNSARICEEHLIGNDWEDLFDAPNLIHNFNSDQISDMFNIFRNAMTRPRLNFENVLEMDSTEFRYLIGFTQEQFLIIFDQSSIARECPHPGNTLAMYLMKLRSGSSDEYLSHLFGTSRRTFERSLTIARKCLIESFVPQHLGFDHISREDVVRKNLRVPNAIHGNQDVPIFRQKAITICDGTYVYVQHSSNFSFQRKSYSLHKYKNLLKPFLMVSCDGYIIDVLGPYAANKSDATIMLEILRNEEELFHWFYSPGDVFVLDRGFRDAMEDFRIFGYKAVMPETKARNEDQLSTEQANRTRLVTLCRWVVEVVNGRFKRDFKLFRQPFFNLALRHMFEDFRIAAALINAFHRPIVDNVQADEFIDRIDQRLRLPNRLADFVKDRNLNRQRVAFQRMNVNDPDFLDFPRLTEDELIRFAVGTYHLKLAKSYFAEHLKPDGNYLIELYRDMDTDILEDFGIEMNDGWILRCQIQSRHRNAKRYNVYILIDSEVNGLDAISHYYCTCVSGKKTLGCCAHVMTVTWFLAHGQYQNNIQLPAGFLIDCIEN